MTLILPFGTRPVLDRVLMDLSTCAPVELPRSRWLFRSPRGYFDEPPFRVVAWSLSSEPSDRVVFRQSRCRQEVLLRRNVRLGELVEQPDWTQYQDELERSAKRSQESVSVSDDVGLSMDGSRGSRMSGFVNASDRRLQKFRRPPSSAKWNGVRYYWS
jgi:hypothetical protein